MMKRIFWVGIIAVAMLAFGVFAYNEYSKPQEIDYRYQLYPEDNVLPKETFSQLPEMPLDFKAVVAKFKAGQLPADRVNSKYYLQPEFYPRWEDKGITTFTDKDLEGYSSLGYGVYPSEYIAVVNSEDEFEVNTFVYSSFGSEYWQGFTLRPLYLSEASMRDNYYSDNQRLVKQDEKILKQHISLNIFPNEFTLGPALNKQSYTYNEDGSIRAVINHLPMFTSDWVKPIKIVVKTKDLPRGRYALVFELVAPSDNLSYAMSSRYLTRYVAGGAQVTNGWQFGIFMDVT